MDQTIYYFSGGGIALEHMKRPPGFNMSSRHFHKEYEIYLLLEGERIFFFNNRSYLIKKGSLILVDTDQIHMTHSVPGDQSGYERIILYLEKTKAAEFDRMFSRLNLASFFREHYGVYELTCTQQEEFLAMYRFLKRESDQKSRNYGIMMDTEIIRYFAGFMRERRCETPIRIQTASSDSSKYQTIYTVADYLSEHFTEPISLDRLAGEFFLSRYYLSRSFKEVTGYGINEYVNILRTKKARQLLEETSMSVSEIASEVGYESITYFEKVFKTFLSISPLKYRRTLSGLVPPQSR